MVGLGTLYGVSKLSGLNGPDSQVFSWQEEHLELYRVTHLLSLGETI